MFHVEQAEAVDVLSCPNRIFSAGTKFVCSAITIQEANDEEK